MSIYIQYGGIIGQASDAEHKGWMTAYRLAWDVDREITSAASTRGDRESSNASMGELSFVRTMDIATVDLFAEACCGQGKQAVIHLTKTGKGRGDEVYMAYTLKNCFVSDYAVSITPDHRDRPMEIITLGFTYAEVRYTSYDDKGIPITSASRSFDAATNIVG